MTNLDDIISGKGTNCPMDAPRDRATWHSILRSLGTTYVGGPLEAMKEFPTNADDAKARNIVIKLENKKRNNSSIMISDDGEGMWLPPTEEMYIRKAAHEYEGVDILTDSILRLPKKIGESAKLFDDAQHGSKAIGALAWQTVSNGVIFISKKKGQKAVAWSCKYESKAGRHNFETKVIKQEDVPELRDLVEGTSGTTVVLNRVSNEIMRQLSPRTIQKDFGSRFRDLLKKGVSITIKDKGNTYKVEPEEYQGKVLIHETVNSKFGPISFELYVNPSRKGVVHIKHGIQTLVDDICTKKGYLNCNAWCSGYLLGQIKADWLKAAAGRQDLEIGPETEEFFKVVKQYNKKVEAAVDEMKKANDPVQRRAFYNQMSRTFPLLLEQFPELESVILGYRTNKTGKVTGKNTHKRTPPKTNGGGGGKPTSTRTQTPPMQVDEDKTGTATAKKTISLKFQDKELPLNVMSDYMEEFNCVVFNKAHPEYIRVMGDPIKKKTYLTALVGKELLSKVYTNHMKLADKIISFQQAYMEYLPL